MGRMDLRFISDKLILRLRKERKNTAIILALIMVSLLLAICPELLADGGDKVDWEIYDLKTPVHQVTTLNFFGNSLIDKDIKIFNETGGLLRSEFWSFTKRGNTSTTYSYQMSEFLGNGVYKNISWHIDDFTKEKIIEISEYHPPNIYKYYRPDGDLWFTQIVEETFPEDKNSSIVIKSKVMFPDGKTIPTADYERINDNEILVTYKPDLRGREPGRISRFIFQGDKLFISIHYDENGEEINFFTINPYFAPMENIHFSGSQERISASKRNDDYSELFSVEISFTDRITRATIETPDLRISGFSIDQVTNINVSFDDYQILIEKRFNNPLVIKDSRNENETLFEYDDRGNWVSKIVRDLDTKKIHERIRREIEYW